MFSYLNRHLDGGCVLNGMTHVEIEDRMLNFAHLPGAKILI